MNLVAHDSDSAVRQDAVRALGEIGDAHAVPLLVDALTTPSLQLKAIEALGTYELLMPYLH